VKALVRPEVDSIDKRTSTLAAIETALNKAGVEFLPAGQMGEGCGYEGPHSKSSFAW
jgi:hypothetical protein